jgi:hypothetical protein
MKQYLLAIVTSASVAINSMEPTSHRPLVFRHINPTQTEEKKSKKVAPFSEHAVNTILEHQRETIDAASQYELTIEIISSRKQIRPKIKMVQKKQTQHVLAIPTQHYVATDPLSISKLVNAHGQNPTEIIREHNKRCYPGKERHIYPTMTAYNKEIKKNHEKKVVHLNSQRNKPKTENNPQYSIDYAQITPQKTNANNTYGTPMPSKAQSIIPIQTQQSPYKKNIG